MTLRALDEDLERAKVAMETAVKKQQKSSIKD
jgi:hypothetical protein